MIADPATAQFVHAAFEALALFAGARLYLYLRRRNAEPDAFAGRNFIVLCGCLLGAAIGNKLVFWAEMPHLLATADGLRLLLGGQSMVGGLLGGLLGTEAAKRLTGVRRSTGDSFVLPILLGLIIGRTGCFLAGLHDGTFGVATDLPWGIDFGDGITRHPAQLYEVVFAALLALALQRAAPVLAFQPGLRFRIMLLSYLVWRLIIDTVKPVPYSWPGGLSGIQWVCLLALAIYLPLTLRQWRQIHVAKEPPLPVP